MDPGIRKIISESDPTIKLAADDPTGAAESDFEAICLRLLPTLFPTSHIFKFKPLIVFNGERWRPDLALVDKDFGFWFVIEVETEVHSLNRHILPQVRAFRDGEYGNDSVELLASALSQSTDRVRSFLRFIPRYVAVISNWPNKDWLEKLREENIQFISIQPFSVDGQVSAFLCEGSLIAGHRSVGFGYVHAAQQVIRVRAGSFWQTREYRITDILGSTVWTCVVESDFAWLTKTKGIIPFADRAIVHLVLQDDGSVSLITL